MEFLTVDLPEPIESKDGKVTTAMYKVRKPKAGDLRGLKTFDLLQMDITAYRTLMPRICPEITAASFDDLSSPNLVAIQIKVSDFFIASGT